LEIVLPGVMGKVPRLWTPSESAEIEVDIIIKKGSAFSLILFVFMV